MSRRITDRRLLAGALLLAGCGSGEYEATPLPGAPASPSPAPSSAPAAAPACNNPLASYAPAGHAEPGACRAARRRSSNAAG